MNKISATILTFNEERRIGACLESLRDVADEIIVVDSGSTDRTLNICRDMGCRISQRPLAGFGSQRQYATSLASHAFVLAIDADEVLSPELRAEILDLKKSGFTHRGYLVPRLNFYCGFAVRHCGWFPDAQVRLFDRRYANWNLHDVSERVMFRDAVKPHLLRGNLLHYRCDTSAEYAERVGRQANLAAIRLVREHTHLSPVASLTYGFRAFSRIFIKHSGWLDGHIGFEIACHHFRAARNMVSSARRLRAESANLTSPPNNKS